MSKPKPRRDASPDVCQVLIWGVSKPLKRAFKSACARKGLTMRDAITAFMRDCTKHEDQITK